MFKRTHSSRCALVILLVFVAAPLLMAAVPAGIDWRVLIVDGTGAAMGTAGNPVVTTPSGSAGSVTQGTSPWVVAGGVAPNAAASQNPILMAGSFGGNVKTLALDTNGQSTTNQGAQNAAGTASWNVQGAGAAGAAISGNPVLAGGSDGTNARALVTDTTGRLAVVGGAANGVVTTGVNPVLIAGFNGGGQVQQLATAFADTLTTGQTLATQQFVFNGAQSDRVRGNTEVTGLASASRTTTQTIGPITTYNCGAIIVVYDNTVGSTYSDTLTINGIDSVSGKTYNLLTSAAIATVTTNVYTVDPALPAVTNVTAQKRLPRTIQIVITSGNSNAHTYSVGYVLQPT